MAAMTDYDGTLAAYRQFAEAVKRAAARFRRMQTPELLVAIGEIARGAAADFAPETPVGDALAALAAQGSLEAIGAMSAIGCSEQAIKQALTAAIERLPDARAGAANRGLELTVEGEVAAGRMVRIVDPATRETKYQTIEGKRGV
jgi:hypothetical protein